MEVTRIKSIEPVNAGSEWRVRVRYVTDQTLTGPAFPGYETQIRGIGAGYTMHQAQGYADSLRRDIACHGMNTIL